MRATSVFPLGLILMLANGCTQSPSPESFMATFQGKYKSGEFADMLEMTADKSRHEFGDEAILKCYENMNFAYDMKFISSRAEDGRLELRYEVEFFTMKSIATVAAVVEGGTIKVLLNDLDETWGRCVQDGV